MGSRRGRALDYRAVADAVVEMILHHDHPVPLLPIYLALRSSGAIDCSFSSVDKATKAAVAEGRIKMQRFTPQGRRLFSRLSEKT